MTYIGKVGGLVLPRTSCLYLSLSGPDFFAFWGPNLRKVY